MKRAAAVLLSASVLGMAQPPPRFVHAHTFGSKHGIRPPKVLNRKAATAVLGEAEHPYGLAHPTSVVADERGRVWIADSGTASVHVFEIAARGYREIRNGAGTLMQQPSGITIDRANRIYVSDAGAGNVFVFDEQGEFHRMLVPPGSGRLLDAPAAIAVAPNGRTIYIADPPRKLIQIFNPEGEKIGAIPLPDTHREPASIAVVGQNVYVQARRQRRIAIFTPAGDLLEHFEWDGIRFLSAFTYDAARRRFLAANPEWMTVEIFDEAGKRLDVFGQSGDRADQVRRIDSLHVDAKGLIYLTDSLQGKVVVFGERGSTVEAPVLAGEGVGKTLRTRQ